MNFFDPFLLARSLRDGTLSEHTRYRLAMMGLFLQGIGSLLNGFATADPSSSRATTSFFYYAIILVGVHFAYQANARGDNRSFIERWICLSAPLLWWLRAFPYALDILLYRLIYVHYGFAATSVLSSITPFIHIWIWGRYILFYVALNFLIRTAASGSSDPKEDAVAPLAAP